MEREVTLLEMLEAREARVFRQQALMKQYALPVISFSLNIAGPVKNSPVIRRTFQEGLSRLIDALRTARINIIHQEKVDQITGCEAILVVQGEAWDMKRLCVELEDEEALGRLFDMDVLDPDGSKLDRESFGHPPRSCLVCAAAGRLWTPEAPWAPAETILEECAAMSKEAVEADFAALQDQTVQTKGQRLFLEHGLRGIRGELADGLPAVRIVGLPALEKALNAGASLEEAGAAALIQLIAKATDTNLIARGGWRGGSGPPGPPPN